MAKPKLLVLTHYYPGTGFTRVMENLLPFLFGIFDIHFLGIGYRGAIIKMPHWTLYPINPEGDVYGSYLCHSMAVELQAAAILILDDIWMFRNHKKALMSLKDNIPMYAYLPLDGDLPDATMIEYLDFLDHVVSYHPKAQLHLETVAAQQYLPPTSAIPHGTDLSNFTSLPDKKAIRATLFGPEHSEDFIVLNANRPGPRKRIDLTLEAFAKFAKGKPNTVKLYLHHWQENEANQQKTREQIAAMGISDRVLLSTLTKAQKHLSDSELNLLYNACAVGINTAMGEGWGMVSFEHAATGAPQIVPNHSACAGLWKDAGKLIPVVKRYQPEFLPLEMGEVDVLAAADALEQLYSDDQSYDFYSMTGQQLAAHPAYQWEAVGKQWMNLLLGEETEDRDAGARPNQHGYGKASERQG